MSEVDRSTYFLIAVIAVIIVGILGFLYYSNTQQASQNLTSKSKLNIPAEELALTLQRIREYKWVINTRIEGDDIVCDMVIYYNDSDFQIIIDDWPSFRESLEENITQFTEPGTTITDLGINYLSNSSSIHIYFRVMGALTRYDDECRATYIWLLKPLGLDLIGSGFQEYDDRLTWSGKINGIEYDITILLPKQDVPYVAWGDEVGHCHGHVWWPCQG